MGVGERDREGVGRVVGFGGFPEPEEARDPLGHLALVGGTEAGDGPFHGGRGVLEDLRPDPRRAEEGDAAPLSDRDRRRRVLPDEDLLDRDGVGPMLGERALEPFVKGEEPCPHLHPARSAERAAIDEARLAAPHLEDANSHHAGAGVDPHDSKRFVVGAQRHPTRA